MPGGGSTDMLSERNTKEGTGLHAWSDEWARRTSVWDIKGSLASLCLEHIKGFFFFPSRGPGCIIAVFSVN